MLDPLVGPVKGDPNRLQQVIWNLLSNAVKFTPKGGKIQIHLERVGSHCEISVSDTGCGIKPEFCLSSSIGSASRTPPQRAWQAASVSVSRSSSSW